MVGSDRPSGHQISLPIDHHRKLLLYLLDRQRILIVSGETGSGKSTRIPQILFDAGIYNLEDQDYLCGRHKLICITQPRRVAAMQLAQRVADNMSCSLGSTVGYAVRNKDVTDPNLTRIKYMTDGLLIQEMIFDPMLTRYSVVMVDEAHERTLNTDILLGLLKCVMIKRKDLKLIICSATLNLEDYSSFFTFEGDSTEEDSYLTRPHVLRVQGRCYPIKVYYRKESVANYVDATIQTVMSIHENSRLSSGKILAFLTGQDEVEYVCVKLIEYAQTYASRLDLKKLYVLPLHASLQHDEIAKIFGLFPRNTRVCVVSTNVAETSLTIDDVAFVVDCGYTKLKLYDHCNGINSLVRVPISKTSAKQRAGRAGRTRDGSVFRLYTKADYDHLDEITIPEVQRSSLTEKIILLKSLGVNNLDAFPLISPIPTDNLISALENLFAMQAINDTGHLTSIGNLMSHFNLDPRISRYLIDSDTSYCTLEKCKIAAMLQAKEIYQKSTKLKQISSIWTNKHLTDICASEGDPLTYLNLINGFITSNKSQKWAEKRNLNYSALKDAVEISERLEHQLKRSGIKVISCDGRADNIQKGLVSGLFLNAAYLNAAGNYKTVRGEQTVFIHPSSIFSEMVDRPKHVVFVEILNTTKPFMRHIMSVESGWLIEAAPHFYTLSTSL